MRYSVVIPAYNEARTIERAVRETVEVFLSLHETFEIVVVDDGSVDGTWDVVPHTGVVRVIRHERNVGKGAAVRTGVLAAQGEWVLYLDADLSVHPSEIRRALPLLDQADVISGSRRVAGAEISRPQAWYRDYSGRLFNLLMRTIVRLSFRDTQCGFKLFHHRTRSLFESLQTLGWAFDVELLAAAQRAGFRIKELPVTWRNGEFSRVRWWDARTIVRDLWRIRQGR